MDCKQCGGTGLIINDKYCRCRAGKRKKAVTESLKAITDVASTKVVAKALASQPVKHATKHTIKVGDWVERDGLVCMVDEISGNDVRVLSFRDVYGDMVKKFGWVEINSVKPMPLEGFEDVIPMAVDLALLTNDPKWFKKVMKVGVTL